MSIQGSHVFELRFEMKFEVHDPLSFLTARVTHFKPRFNTAPASQRSWFESRSALNFSGLRRYTISSVKELT